MRHRTIVLATSILLLVLHTELAAQAKRDWQAGTWRDTSRASETVGAVTNGTTNGGSVSASTTTVQRVHQLYVIETPDYVYQAEQRLRWRWSKPVPLTVNESMKFAIEKGKIFVIGEDAKEYELTLVKKVKKVG